MSFPLPRHLQEAGYGNTVNVAVLGAPGSGSSSLVNALMRKTPKDPGAAPTGSTRTTTRPSPYAFLGEGEVEDNVKQDSSGKPSGSAVRSSARVWLWDLPGISAASAMENVCRDLGLLYYDVILIVCSRRVMQGVVQLIRELSRQDVPYFVVRTKIDIDVRCEESDHMLTESEALQVVRKGLLDRGFESVFLVSARNPEKYDLQRLVASLMASVVARRGSMELEDACLVCGQTFVGKDDPSYSCTACEVEVCMDCFTLLSGGDSEAYCPRCNQPAAVRSASSWWFWWLPSWRSGVWTGWLWVLS